MMNLNWLSCCSMIVVGTLAMVVPTGVRAAANKIYPVTTDGGFLLAPKFVPVNPSEPGVWVKLATQSFVNEDDDVSKYIVKNSSGKEMIVDSCVTLFKADFHDFNRIQIIPGGWNDYRSWADDCYNALFVSRMIPSHKSYIAGFKLNASTVKLLPANVMSPYEFDNPNEGVHLPGDIGSAMPAHPAEITYDAKTDDVEVSFALGGTQYFGVIARGDYNHDGVEDLLIGTYYAIGGGGTLNYRESFVITRTQPNGPFRILKSFSPTEGTYPFKQWVKIGP